MQANTPSEPDFWSHDPDDLPLHEMNEALAASALHNTQLAIARWTGGIHRPRMLQVGSLHVSPQARWYAKTCNGLQQWVEGGGFSQHEDAALAKFCSEQPRIEIDSTGACVD